MPYIKQDLKEYRSCAGAALTCSKNILNKMSDFKTVSDYLIQRLNKFILIKVFDPFQLRNKTCLQGCEDQLYQVQTTTSTYPAEPIFEQLKDYCLLILKFVEQCKVPVKKVSHDLCHSNFERKILGDWLWIKGTHLFAKA